MRLRVSIFAAAGAAGTGAAVAGRALDPGAVLAGTVALFWADAQAAASTTARSHAALPILFLLIRQPSIPTARISRIRRRVAPSHRRACTPRPFRRAFALRRGGSFRTAG